MVSKLIERTWLVGKQSCTLVLPKKAVAEAGLDMHDVVVENTPEGILIRKRSN